MNLSQNPCISELSALIARQVNYNNKYDILVDYNGEVLIKPHRAGRKSSKKYRFYFEGFEGIDKIGIIASRNIRYMNQLYKDLIYCWENQCSGYIDKDEITSIRTIAYWLESNNISSAKTIEHVPVFFSHPSLYKQDRISK